MGGTPDADPRDRRDRVSRQVPGATSATRTHAFGDEGDRALDSRASGSASKEQIGRYAEFQVERELGDDDDPWRDVFVNYQQFDEAQFQYGKFKLPFSLDENTSSTNLDFVYRSLAASTLAPGRDIGWMVHGRVVKRILRYEFGIFEHDGRNARPRATPTRVFGGQTIAGRIVLRAVPLDRARRPTTSARRRLDVERRPRRILGTARRDRVRAAFFSSDYYVLGRAKRLGFEMRWRPGPFSIQVRVHQGDRRTARPERRRHRPFAAARAAAGM